MIIVVGTPARINADNAERCGLDSGYQHYCVELSNDEGDEDFYAEYTVTLDNGKVYATEIVFGAIPADRKADADAIAENNALVMWNKGE